MSLVPWMMLAQQAQAAARPQTLPALTGAPNGQPMAPNQFTPPPQAPKQGFYSAQGQAMPAPGSQPQQQGFMQRLNSGFASMNENPMFNMGLSLLGNAQNGGNWGGVLQDMRQFGQDARERQVLQNEQRRQKIGDAREEASFGWQQQDRQVIERQRADWEAAVAGEQDPQNQRVLRAMGPQGYGEWMAAERQRRFLAEQGQLDRDTTLRAANARAANENSLGRYFQSMDAQTMGALNEQATQLRAVGLPQLQSLRSTIAQAGTSLTGQPIDYNTRITLGRWFNGSSADRQNLEVWRAQILGPALETLRGLGAMSEREMDAAIESFSNPNMTLGAAMQLIDQRIEIANRRIATAQAATQYFRDAGGLTGVTNSAGQDWSTYLNETLNPQTPSQQTPPAPSAGSAARQDYPAPNQAAVAELRRDSSAAARREFDEVFGPGAAERVLASARQQSTSQAARSFRPGAF